MEMKPADGTSSLFMHSSLHRTHYVNRKIKEITFSFKAISRTSIQLKLVFLRVFMMSSFTFLKVLLFRTASVSYIKDR